MLSSLYLCKDNLLEFPTLILFLKDAIYYYRKREDGAGESSLSGWSDSDIETAAREKSGDSGRCRRLAGDRAGHRRGRKTRCRRGQGAAGQGRAA